MPEPVRTEEAAVAVNCGATATPPDTRRLSGLTLFHRPVGDRTVVSVRGDLDLDGDADEPLRRALRSALGGTDGAIGLDLDGVEPCGCSAVNILLSLGAWHPDPAGIDPVVMAEDAARDEEERDLRLELAHLRRAMRSRGVIDMARGILVAAFGLSPDDSWEALVTVSQHTNTKLHEVARQLVECTHGTTPLPDALQESLSAVVAAFAD
ncbi:ANTAR domain-containing protein [Streptomyces sp. SID14478]|uniref:ANTAR domain-containing protein n=1 Tax=Streptomyces sp. SID14478 TaxID=2706073 RepID=UPI0013DBE5A9|nr:ANTAR domain-containing protein [Streptomyces sp. SID14478]NEB73672.1 ANTAR domain-containing protein [Streptomyces sp. SID14478]